MSLGLLKWQRAHLIHSRGSEEDANLLSIFLQLLVYWAWLNSGGVLCSPYVFPQECFEVYGLSKAFRLNLYSSSLFWNLAQSAPHSATHIRIPLIFQSRALQREEMLGQLLLKTIIFKNNIKGTSLPVQWLRLHCSNSAGNQGSIPDLGTPDPTYRN